MSYMFFPVSLLALLAAAPTVLPGSDVPPDEASHRVRVTSTSGEPVAVNLVRLELAGQDVRITETESRETPFVVEAGSMDVGATFESGAGEIKVELLRGSVAVMEGVGQRVVLDQRGRGVDLEARVRVLR